MSLEWDKVLAIGEKTTAVMRDSNQKEWWGAGDHAVQTCRNQREKDAIPAAQGGLPLPGPGPPPLPPPLLFRAGFSRRSRAPPRRILHRKTGGGVPPPAEGGGVGAGRQDPGVREGVPPLSCPEG